MKKQKSISFQSNIVALLAACCIFLSAFEYIIPKPIPFLRIGLANLPILIGITLLPFPAFLLLICMKVCFQGLIYGTFFSHIIILSAGGTFSSSIAMFFLYKFCKKYISFIGISVTGALLSNTVQLYLAGLLFFGPSVWLISPPFYIIGGIAGLLLGVFTNTFTGKSMWLTQCRELLYADNS
ncbi:MAG: Gx transporter family protein [Spirochaetales bacterium]|nr:Gx transporter family protein [Spirochaetales bacterium]